MIEVERDGERLALEITAATRQAAGSHDYWALGIGPASAAMPDTTPCCVTGRCGRAGRRA